MIRSVFLRSALRSCFLAAALAGTAFLATRALASPPPPPPKPIRVSFSTHPAGNSTDRQYVIRMKMWYDDGLFYEGTAAYGFSFPPLTTPAAYQPGGTLKTELTLLNASGQVLETDRRTRTNLFSGSFAWLGGSVRTPDGKHRHTWHSSWCQEVRGMLELTFKIENNSY